MLSHLELLLKSCNPDKLEILAVMLELADIGELHLVVTYDPLPDDDFLWNYIADLVNEFNIVLIQLNEDLGPYFEPDSTLGPYICIHYSIIDKCEHCGEIIRRECWWFRSVEMATTFKMSYGPEFGDDI